MAYLPGRLRALDFTISLVFTYSTRTKGAERVRELEMVKDRVSRSIQNDDELKDGNGYTWLDIDRAALQMNKTPRFIVTIQVS
jgi:hypothetical protein